MARYGRCARPGLCVAEPRRSSPMEVVAAGRRGRLRRGMNAALWIALTLVPASNVVGPSPLGVVHQKGGMPYEAFDQLPVSRLPVGGGTIEVAFTPGEIDLGRQPLLDWITAAGRAVAVYYGRLPVSRVQVLVMPAAGRGIRSGTTFGYRGAAIKIAVGRETQAEDLGRDWVMTHEMVHVAFPDIAGEHAWIGEGIATYVEPLGRVQAGQLPAEKIRADLMWGLPKGLP